MTVMAKPMPRRIQNRSRTTSKCLLADITPSGANKRGPEPRPSRSEREALPEERSAIGMDRPNRIPLLPSSRRRRLEPVDLRHRRDGLVDQGSDASEHRKSA